VVEHIDGEPTVIMRRSRGERPGRSNSPFLIDRIREQRLHEASRIIGLRAKEYRAMQAAKRAA
jgi:hypothetical protein